MRPALLAFGLAASLAAALPAALAQEKVVNIYNWSDYIDPEVLEDFAFDEDDFFGAVVFFVVGVLLATFV